jgi:molybdopterin biosynthesis enzyme MoaB
MKSIKIRLTSGIRKSTLIINFPGSAKACGECLVIIEPVLQHAIDQLREYGEYYTHS